MIHINEISRITERHRQFGLDLPDWLNTIVLSAAQQGLTWAKFTLPERYNTDSLLRIVQSAEYSITNKPEGSRDYGIYWS